MDIGVQRSMEAGPVTDLLVNEIVADSAAEHRSQQNRNVVDRQSAFSGDATPSVEGLLQRLCEIEVTRHPC